MASLACSNTIQMTEETLRLIKPKISTTVRDLEVKGRGNMLVYSVDTSLDIPLAPSSSVIVSEFCVKECARKPETDDTTEKQNQWSLSMVRYIIGNKFKTLFLMDHVLGSSLSKLHFNFWLSSSGVICVAWLVYPPVLFWIGDLVIFPGYF